MGKIGLLGGAFDPPHVGHLRLALEAREQLELERVLLVPTASPPHRAPAVASFDQRLELLRLAIGETPGLEACAIERELPAPSYTVRTVEALRAQGHAIVLLIGEDSLSTIRGWHRAGELLAQVELAVAPRPGQPAIAGAPPHRRLACPALPIASHQLRERAAAGRSLRFLVPEPARLRIAELGLYRA